MGLKYYAVDAELSAFADVRYIRMRLFRIRAGGLSALRPQPRNLLPRLSLATLTAVAFVLCLTILFGAGAAHAELTYTVTDLGGIERLRGELYGVMAINERGQVVGGNGHAFLWTGGKLADFGTLPPGSLEDTTIGVAYGINTRGQIVGSSGSFGPVMMSGLQWARGILIDKGVMHQFTKSETSCILYAINDAGEIVGLDGYRGFYYAHGRLTELGTLSQVPQGNRSTARSLNSLGQVVGWSTVNGPRKAAYDSLPAHGFLWQYGVQRDRMRDLGTLPGWINSYAYGINRRGEVIGSVSDAASRNYGVSSNSHAVAFLWRKGKMTSLGTLPGSKNSEAFGINDNTFVVGTSDAHAVLWTPGKMLDLNTCLSPLSGWTLEEARAINNCGQIVGSGRLNGQRHLFLLTPQQSK